MITAESVKTRRPPGWEVTRVKEARRLYRIGELARITRLSPRTIDYYTAKGLIRPASRTVANYRLYGSETLERLKRIEQLKKEKYTLEEIKRRLDDLDRVGTDRMMAEKLTSLQILLHQLSRETQELKMLLGQTRPQKAKTVWKRLAAQSAACLDALLFLTGKQPPLS